MLWMQRRHPTLFLSSGRRVLGSANQPGLPRLSRSSLNAATRTYCYMHLKMCSCTWGYNHVISPCKPKIRVAFFATPSAMVLGDFGQGISRKIHDGHSTRCSSFFTLINSSGHSRAYEKTLGETCGETSSKIDVEALNIFKLWIQGSTSSRQTMGSNSHVPVGPGRSWHQPSWSSTRTKKRSSCLGSRVADAASCAADAAICAASWSTSSQLKQYPHIGYPLTGKFKCLQSKGDTLP